MIQLCFGFDGLPGSGKTSLTRILVNKGFFRIGEILDENYDEINPDQVETPDTEYFLGSDLRKYKLAEEMIKQGKPVTLDRTILSTLAYTNLETRLTGRDSYSPTLDWLRDNVLGLVDSLVYVYLNIGVAESVNRKRKDPNPTDLWSHPTNLAITAKFYDDTFRNLKEGNALHIDATQPLEKVLEDVLHSLPMQRVNNTKDGYHD